MRVINAPVLGSQKPRYTLSIVPFDHPAVIAARVMLARVLTKYGLTLNSSRDDLDSAITDFVYRVLPHPHPLLHPNGSTANSTVLPAGKTWAGFNTTHNASPKVSNDNNYWFATFGWDTVKRFEYSFGTLNRTDGSLSANGQLEEYVPGQWRIRDMATFKASQCTQQDTVKMFLCAAVGIPAGIVQVDGHDASWSYIVDDKNTLGGDYNYIWSDLTYGERYRLDGEGRPLSPLDLYYYSASGQMGRLKTLRRTTGPSHDPAPYPAFVAGTDTAYFAGNPAHPNGMTIIGTMLGIGGYTDAPNRMTHLQKQVQLATPGIETAAMQAYLPPANAPRVDAATVFPYLGARITSWQPNAVGVNITLASSWCGPGTHTFERRINGGAWTALARAADTLVLGTGVVEYRPVDSQGFRGSRVSVQT